MKVSLIALITGCAVASSAFALTDSMPTQPPRTTVLDSMPTQPPRATVLDSMPTQPPRQI